MILPHFTTLVELSGATASIIVYTVNLPVSTDCNLALGDSLLWFTKDIPITVSWILKPVSEEQEGSTLSEPTF